MAEEHDGEAGTKGRHVRSRAGDQSNPPTLLPVTRYTLAARSTRPSSQLETLAG